MFKIIIYPLLRHRNQFYNKSRCLIHISSCNYNKEDKLTTSRRTELDTNVKPLGEKVKETTKTVTYLGVILLGVGVTGTLFYSVFKELFSSQSPNNIYTKAVDKCIADHRISDKLGTPIKSFGEQTRRGRRQHVTHAIYERDGKKYMRMRFYLQGTVHKATVNLEMMENDSGKFDYRYLFVDIDDMFHSTVVLEDNRHSHAIQTPTQLDIFS